MATNAPASRKTHIVRIFGVDRQGNIIPDMYADVERMDVVKQAMQIPPDRQWQGTQRTFHWCDDPNSDDYAPDGTPSRIIEIVKVCDPTTTTNFEDPDEYIPIKSVKGIRTRVEGQEINGGTGMDRFLASVTNEELTTARVVQVRQIVHHDTSIDAAAAAAAANGQKEYVVDPANYEKDLSTRDDTQHIDQEIILYLKHKGNVAALAGLARQTKLLNQYLIDESDPPSGDVTGPAGYNPPYRFDFLQSIINIKFSSGPDQQWLLAITNGTGTISGLNIASDVDVLAADGARWTAYAGASGLGFTVIAGAVAYGKATLNDGTTMNCFLACDANMRSAKLGTLSNGKISWQAAWSVPTGGDHPEDVFISSISYAKDRFFITFLDQNAVMNIVSTRDGKSFSVPQAPLPSRGSGTGPLGGGVAYVETDAVHQTGVFAVIGYELQDDTETEDHLAFSAGFCWATSNNGTSWSGGKIEGVFEQPGGGGGYVGNLNLTSQSFIAAGNGVFVAAASKRNEVFEQVGVFDDEGNLIGTRDAPYILTSAAVAVSTNGTSWSLVPLPGAIFIQSNVDGDVGGTTTGVRFIQDKSYRDQRGNTGYFVACGYEGAAQGFENAKLWKSVDGRSWSLIRSETHHIPSPAGGNYVGLSAIDKVISKVSVL
ncbi:hypothetical protein ACE10Z_23700 [Bradyrhizobium sp. Pha-3]|uniref:hypothetical protein n=1 Tax=Bradyrhizobium sp. Pha-3 TaxID=208375 RepID=UPI0035D3E5E6